MKHTYQLIDAIIFKDARVKKHEKEEINRSLVLESFSRVFLFLFLSRLNESFHKVSFQLISKLTIKGAISPNSMYHQNK